ncbi:MAG: flippase-like domain-containing protein [Phascolarctobacterium sp.]|nr:flippase-like domain-containing protein [Phascolarctobacterium sp.]
MVNDKVFMRLLLVFCFVFLVSVAVIYFTFDIKAITYLSMFHPWCILLALGCLMVGLIFDGLRLITLADVTNEKLSAKQVVNVVLSNYFLALVTPGASGGSIAQIMFMRKAGVPVAKATVVILVRIIMSIFFLILLMPVVLNEDQDIVDWIPASVIMVVSVLFICIPVAAFSLMRTQYPEKWLEKILGKFSYTTQQNCLIWYKEFKNAFAIMAKHPFKMVRAFLESGASLLAIYSTVPAFFSGMNIEYDLLQVIGRMVLINLVIYFSPTPGGSGIAEAGFVVLFSNILPSGLVGIMAVLWRFTAEYLPFLLGAFVSIRALGSDVMALSPGHRENNE